MASLRENYAQNVKRLLTERKMTQREFAKEIGVDEALVSKWMNRIHFPEDRFIDKTIVILKCSYEELVRGPDGKVPDAVYRFLRDFAQTHGYDLVKKK